MLIRAGYDIKLTVNEPTPLTALLSIHPSRIKDLRTPQRVKVEPMIETHDHLDVFGNLATRLVLPAGTTTLSSDFVIQDSGEVDIAPAGQRQNPVNELPDDVLPYLLGSRYCETDRLSQIAWRLFGNTEAGPTRVQAIVDFVHHHITFGYDYARPTMTAWNAFEERHGVCRDFAHLAIALCRCMNIPARYCTGYLGDIGVPFNDAPMDFSAWFEVYLGSQWYTFDARHNIPRIGRILMARGRDATDTALTTAFGFAGLASFEVQTYELPEEEARARA
jgi:transglutaminase-like putative cysteine protease